MLKLTAVATVLNVFFFGFGYANANVKQIAAPLQPPVVTTASTRAAPAPTPAPALNSAVVSAPRRPHPSPLPATPRCMRAPRVLSRGRGRALAYRSASRRCDQLFSDASGQRLARNPLPRATRGALDKTCSGLNE